MKEFLNLTTMFLSCLFKELLPFENCKMYRNVLKNKKLSNKTTLKLRLESRFTESVLMTKYERIFEFESLRILLILSELLPFENCKMYRTCTKKKF